MPGIVCCRTHALQNRLARHAVGLDWNKLDPLRRGLVFRKRKHDEQLEHAPQPLKVRLAAYHEQLLARRDVDAQDLEPVADVFLVDADLVEPERGFPVVLGLELLLDLVENRELGLGVVVPAVGHEVVDVFLVRPKLADGGQGRQGVDAERLSFCHEPLCHVLPIQQAQIIHGGLEKFLGVELGGAGQGYR